MSLKSLAENVISRNQQCNTSATGDEFTRNKSPENTATVLRTLNATTASARGPTHTDDCEILAWLGRIGEGDPVVLRETLNKCRANPDALRFFLECARSGTVH